MAPSAWPTAEAIIANISVLAIFASLVAAGIMKGVKEVRDFRKPDAATSPSTTAQVAAATILENVTLAEWSRTNMLVVEAIRELMDCLSRDRESRLDMRLETAELRHAIADLTKVMERG